LIPSQEITVLSPDVIEYRKNGSGGNELITPKLIRKLRREKDLTNLGEDSSYGTG
jgi:hypothetical protein